MNGGDTTKDPMHRWTYAEAHTQYANADLKNAIATAERDAEKRGEDKGREEGRAEGRAEGLTEGLEKGRTEGLTEGMAKANLDNARKMKAKGFSVNDIAEITGLTLEEIETL